MKTTIIEKREVEITFPYYGKGENGFIKIESENHAIEIYAMMGNTIPLIITSSNRGEDGTKKLLQEYNTAITEDKFLFECSKCESLIEERLKVQIDSINKEAATARKRFNTTIMPLLNTTNA